MLMHLILGLRIVQFVDWAVHSVKWAQHHGSNTFDTHKYFCRMDFFLPQMKGDPISCNHILSLDKMCCMYFVKQQRNGAYQ